MARPKTLQVGAIYKDNHDRHWEVITFDECDEALPWLLRRTDDAERWFSDEFIAEAEGSEDGDIAIVDGPVFRPWTRVDLMRLVIDMADELLAEHGVEVLDAEEVRKAYEFRTQAAKERALAKLSQEEREALGL